MIKDLQGNSISEASADAVDYYNQAVAAFNIYTGDPFSLVSNAIEDSPHFAMAHIFKAYLLGLATEPILNGYAKDTVRHLKTLHLSDREASHLGALDLMLHGEWTAAALVLDIHNSNYPLDIVALQAGHLMDFYRANARNLRDRLARVLPYWSNNVPGYSVLLGMYAFGLEETGDYDRAEETGRKATELQPRDCWAHHAVAHVLEMQGRVIDGVKWMSTREKYWSEEDNFFKVHNWWHRAIYHQELEQNDVVLSIYDNHIRHGNSTVALELVDASAMLWRLHLDGVDVGDRWDELADCWQTHADGHSYTFNDWHAVMAYLGAGRDIDAEQILKDCKKINPDPKSEMQQWTQKHTLPLIEGFIAFWRKDYQTAIEQLYGARFIANSFGGSHAQRDIIDLTLIEAAIRAGQPELARALANERLALKPNSRLNQGFLARSKSWAVSGIQ
ncbi:tetratricopeptide repeat protein [Advenella sp. WQ 585]|uniref:Tetratricopeptide repeat protein 38 n=1 Tax=Advenella mandrilli TaxID=2800330 RepID=A0ABS1E977_9BURK|nr:tetratricopeptide repeat protein [Advenella mandrilli]MBK1779979.1 tetratricopeptide repeat protein [Advenella mandrilli]